MVDIKNDFFLVEASELSLKDTFMNHKPQDEFERRLLDDFYYVITSNIKDFYCSKTPPVLSDVDSKIIGFENSKQKYYVSYQFWNKVAKKFCKEKRSRIGSRYEHSAYLGTVMKQLISCGMPVNQAWKWIHDIRGLYYFIKDFPKYQSIDISYYENNEKLLSDDKGIIAKIRNSMPICIFDRKFFFFSDETVEYHKLYGGWIGGYSYCVPWIVCDA